MQNTISHVPSVSRFVPVCKSGAMHTVVAIMDEQAAQAPCIVTSLALHKILDPGTFGRMRYSESAAAREGTALYWVPSGATIWGEEQFPSLAPRRWV